MTARATSPTAPRANSCASPTPDGSLVATPRTTGSGAHPQPAHPRRRHGHRSPRRALGRRDPRQHGRGRRRRRGRPVRGAREQAALGRPASSRCRATPTGRPSPPNSGRRMPSRSAARGGIKHIRDMFDGIGPDIVLECVEPQSRWTRPSGRCARAAWSATSRAERRRGVCPSAPCSTATSGSTAASRPCATISTSCCRRCSTTASTRAASST